MQQKTSSVFERNPKKTGVALALFILISIFLLAEFATSLLAPEFEFPKMEDGGPWAHDPLLGWSHKPYYRGKFSSTRFSVDVNSNADGMRDKSYEREKGPLKRMLILGDSFGWGWGVEQDQVFTELLEVWHPNWEIINASVAGYGTDQEYLYLKDRGLSYQPDVVLMLFCSNDFVNNASSEQYYYSKPAFQLDENQLEVFGVPVPEGTLRQKLLRFIDRNTHLTKAVLYRLGYLAKASNAELVTLALIEKTADLAIDNGAQFILVSVPMPKMRLEELKRLSDARDISFLPLDSAFDGQTDRLTFPDGHWNVEGHHLAAKAIEEFLLKKSIL